MGQNLNIQADDIFSATLARVAKRILPLPAGAATMVPTPEIGQTLEILGWSGVYPAGGEVVGRLVEGPDKKRVSNAEKRGRLMRAAPPGKPVTGRNEACPCGSGRKSKKCHRR